MLTAGIALGVAGLTGAFLIGRATMIIAIDSLASATAGEIGGLRRHLRAAADIIKNLRSENARLRRQNIALRARCGAPPELVDRDLKEWA